MIKFEESKQIRMKETKRGEKQKKREEKKKKKKKKPFWL
jgi:hypothetical protein